MPQPALASLPRELRDPVLAGVRWTFWLAALGMPLGYATRLLLARAGPPVIGAFGVLLIYINLVSTFLFLGGNAVAIRFLPLLAPERRRSFLTAYAGIVLLAFLPWFALAALWPRGLHFLFGNLANPSWQQWLLWLSPLYIALSLLTAGLKGLLRIKAAQLLVRTVTAGSFVAYAALYFVGREFLMRHYVGLIWGIYLSLSTLAAGVALFLFLRHTPRRSPGTPRFLLPPRFWRYTFGLQGNSAITFLGGQLDMLFVLHWGGVGTLGVYVALMTLLAMTPTILDVLLDSLLPSLTNALATAGSKGVDELVETFSRLLLPGAFALATFLLFFAAPLVQLFGGQYAALVPLVRAAAPLAAVEAASHLFGTIFSAAGQPHRPAWAQLARVALFIAAFPPLWRHYGLPGAVAAWIAAEVVAHLVLLFQLRHYRPLRFSLRGGYLAMWAGLLVAAAVAWLLPALSLPVAAALWMGLVAGYAVAARYSPGELRRLARMLLPGRATPA